MSISSSSLKVSKVTPARLEAWKQLVRGPSLSYDAADSRDALDRRESALADRIIKGVLRYRAILDAYLERERLFDPSKTPSRIMWILRIAAYECIFQNSAPDYAIGGQAVALARKASGEHAAKFVNAMMRRILKTLPHTLQTLETDPFYLQLPDAIRWSMAQEVMNALNSGYPGVRDELFTALLVEESPVWIRVNTLRTNRDDLRVSLGKEGCDVEADPVLEKALVWRGGERIWKTKAWLEGKCTIQDWGAMLAGELIAPDPGSNILDCCAAPGGKSGDLWERMLGRGRLVAFDPDSKRRQVMREAFTRLYGSHLIEVPEKSSLDQFKDELFDQVLVDAPCHALGLIRRHPEIRWDGRLAHLSQVQKTQSMILESAAKLVKQGGRLIWCTCSPTLSENEVLLDRWLALNPQWRPYAIQIRDDYSLFLRDGSFVVRTRPDQVMCDGFSYAILERRSEA